MTLELKQLLDDVKQRSGIQQKVEIQTVARALKAALPNPNFPNGDDAAVIVRPDGYDLIAGEGFISKFVETDPWFAGWCGVMVNVSDIAAMGGRPCAVTNTLWGYDVELCEQILAGMAAASSIFNVPIVGGHTNLRSANTQFGASIFGRANALLSSFSAQADHVLVAAIDLRGEFRKPFLNWNAATTAPPDRLRGDVELLANIAEQRWAHSAKDISQAGLLGTCLMLLESSQVGANIDLKRIPKPNNVEWIDWLCCFPSFGYLLTTPRSKLDGLLQAFDARNISAADIGYITTDKLVCIEHELQTELFWNIATTPVTGMTSLNNDLTTQQKVAHA